MKAVNRGRISAAIARFGRRPDGAVGTEYALLAALVAGSVAMIYDYVAPAAAGQTEVAVRLPSAEGTTNAGVLVSSSPDGYACCPTGECSHYGSTGRIVAATRPVFLCLGLVLSGVYWTSLHNRRRAVGHTRIATAAHGDAVSSRLPEGLFAKRQQLLNLMTSQMTRLLETQLQVRHLMSDRLTMISPRMKLEDVRQLMTEKKLRHLLVCDQEKRLIGVISDRDLKARGGRVAADILTPDPMSISPDTPVNTAVSMLINNGFSCLPVLRDGQLCGILTSTDVLLAFQCSVQLLEKIAQEMHADAPAPGDGLANAPAVATMAGYDAERN
jgi:CBS domain-containing protein